ncbi:hypothetical protein WDW89_23630 [Deltaproteobacteria bacterium TL4]
MLNTLPKQTSLPDFLSGVLWSYDLNALDIQKNAKRIITNTLLYGDIEAVQWLFKNYSREEIRTAIERPLKGEWDVKSLHFWSGYFDLVPNTRTALKVVEPAL